MVACNAGRQFNILIYMHVSESYCDDILCYSFAKYLLIYEAFCACKAQQWQFDYLLYICNIDINEKIL